MTDTPTSHGLETGRLQVYTGDGKGKTTAALGLALRAAGAGLRVFIGQFMKGRNCSELSALTRFNDVVTVKQFGTGTFVMGEPSVKDIEAAHNGLAEAREATLSGDYDVVILDEANGACDMGLITVDELIALVDERPANVELVVTGRKADLRLIEKADLVTDMREIKHYYHTGLQARTGIEK